MLAHSANAQGKYHSLVDHLQETAKLARSFGQEFGAGELAYYAGLWHDLGKFSPEFQNYLVSGKRHYGPEQEHKTAGALLAVKHWEGLAFLLAGHHGGLPSKNVLKARLHNEGRTARVQRALELARAQVLGLEPPQPLEQRLPAFLADGQASSRELSLRTDLFLCILFSALVDADYLDTERHFHPGEAARRGGTPSLKTLWQKLEVDQQALSGKRKDALG